ncbi:MAG: NAD(P)/FAD-dependent oxidoreductase [Candidatus Methylomirabilales bacterium]
MQSVLIAGGGIAGLTCAINLAARGIPVEIHEAKRYCGKAIRDIEYLENWSFPEDALDTVRRCGLQPTFDHQPIHSFKAYSPSLREVTVSARAPLMYRVWRGPAAGSIDEALERQTKDAGVTIRYASRLPEERATVIAWGPRRPNLLIAGIEFHTSAQDSIEVLTDDACAPQFYAYRIVDDGRGVVVTGSPADHADGRRLLERTLQRFQQIRAVPMATIRRFGYGGALRVPSTAVQDGRLYVGEAAGFQDCLFAFGMRYAMLSGYLAARALAEGQDYDRSWRDAFEHQLSVGARNRRLYSLFGNPGYEAMIRILASKNPLVARLRRGRDARELLAHVYARRMPRIFQVGALLARVLPRRW